MGKQKYHEELLHWIWGNGGLMGVLRSVAGKKITVYHPGIPNPTDGPDFTGAQIGIGGLTWYGDVEIHWKASDWYKHGHHTDPNYKSVVLHVVFEDENGKRGGPDLPVLCMKPYLSKPLHTFFEGFSCDKGLPCSQKLSIISPGALEAQIAKAHILYFERKADDLLRFYDPELSPSKAWRNLLTIALFDGLGIANNREPMRQLARVLLINDVSKIHSLAELTKLALREAKNDNCQWKKKGSRPVNHPEPRIKQGCELLWHIAHTPFKMWFNTNIQRTFNSCIESVETKPGLGKQRAGILFGTVWLPASYILGDLFGSQKLSSAAKQTWVEYRTSLPASVRRPFKQAGIPEMVYRQKLGTVYQLRSFCKARQCHRCEVFKSAIGA